MYGLELLVQAVLFLRAFHLAFHARIDVAVDVEFFDLAFQDLRHAVQTIQDVEIFEQFLFFLDGNLQIGGDGIGELGGIFDARRGNHGVVIQALGELHILLKQAVDAANRLIDLRRRLDAHGHEAQRGAIEALFAGKLHNFGALHAFDQNANIAVGQLHTLHNIGEGADGKDLLRLGVIDRSVVLGGEENLFFSRERLFQRAHRGFPPDDEGLHHLREDDHVPHRHHRHALHFTLLASKH